MSLSLCSVSMVALFDAPHYECQLAVINNLSIVKFNRITDLPSLPQSHLLTELVARISRKVDGKKRERETMNSEKREIREKAKAKVFLGK